MATVHPGPKRDDTAHAGVSRRSRKRSVSLRPELVEEILSRVGDREFSAWLAEKLAQERLDELAEWMEREGGHVSEQALAEAREVWPPR
jgi:hypothetical protein